MENEIYEYVKRNSGFVNIVDISRQFNIGFVEAQEYISSLTRKLKIRRQDIEDNSAFLVACEEKNGNEFQGT